MAITTISSIDLASDVKKFISSVSVKYSDKSLRDKILKSNNNDFLKITKTIGSDTTITNVSIVDDDYIERAVRGN